MSRYEFGIHSFADFISIEYFPAIQVCFFQIQLKQSLGSRQRTFGSVFWMVLVTLILCTDLDDPCALLKESAMVIERGPQFND